MEVNIVYFVFFNFIQRKQLSNLGALILNMKELQTIPINKIIVDDNTQYLHHITPLNAIPYKI